MARKSLTIKILDFQDIFLFVFLQKFYNKSKKISQKNNKFSQWGVTDGHFAQTITGHVAPQTTLDILSG
tara:strand:+ start:4606 stop:4812 length:207 start_codon:yes stop_codon:yes gene_type:complete